MSKSNESHLVAQNFWWLLGLMFIGLKLGNVIDWQWVWVLAPLWIPITGVLVILFLAALICGAIFLFRK